MSNKTVFVVGAGASEEANLPTGDGLKTEIAKLLDIQFDHVFGEKLQSGDHKIVQALRFVVQRNNRSRRDISPFLEEVWHIRDALPLAISIDNFIDAHRDNEKITLCGKLAIVFWFSVKWSFPFSK